MGRYCALDATYQLHVTLAFPGHDAVLQGRYGLFACAEHATNAEADRVIASTVGRERFDHFVEWFNSTPDWNRSHALWDVIDSPDAIPLTPP